MEFASFLALQDSLSSKEDVPHALLTQSTMLRSTDVDALMAITRTLMAFAPNLS